MAAPHSPDGYRVRATPRGHPGRPGDPLFAADRAPAPRNCDQGAGPSSTTSRPGAQKRRKQPTCTRRKDEIEIGLRGSPGNRRFRRCRAECRRHAAGHAVCARQCISRGDDAGRLLEHRGPLRDRPADRRPGELRQQVPRRGGGLHGHRPRRDLRRGGGDRGRLPAVSAHPSRLRRTPRPRPRSRRQRTTRSSVCSRRSASTRASRRFSTATMPPIWRRSRTARRRRTDSPSAGRSRQR